MTEARLWLLHLLAGAALLVLLGAHLVVMHLPRVLAALGAGPADPLTFASVAERAASPAWPVLYLLLLFVALYHGLYGLRGIVLELTGAARKAKVLVSTVLIILGAAALFYGALVVFRF